MAIAVDLMVLSIVLLFVFLGYKRGLVKVAFKLCTFFIAIILAFMLYKPVAKIVIENTNIDETIETKITDKILPEGKTETDEVDLSESLPTIILKNSENTVQSIAKSCSNTLIETACLVLIFIITKIVLKFVTALADLIAKLPILKQFNKLGGTIYGIIEGLFIVFLGFAVISLIAPMLDVSVLEAINSSTLGSICYNNNILLKIIM
jgi:colicin V production protein